MTLKKTPRKTRYRIGSEKPNAKLDEKKVREARKLHDHGYSLGWLADYYSVSIPTMRKAVTGEKWRHVPQ